MKNLLSHLLYYGWEILGVSCIVTAICQEDQNKIGILTLIGMTCLIKQDLKELKDGRN